MSFGGFGGGGGGGSSGFGGGFGSTQNTNTGFGSTTNNSGFGSTNNATGGGGGLFGNSGGNAFGAKPAGFGGFGSTPTTSAGTSLFGSTPAPSTGGFGFGGTSTQPSAFGTPSGGGGLFGQKTAGFGATPSNPFGGSTSNTLGFGQNTGSSGFTAAPAASALGQTGECQGTGNVPFQATIEKEPNSNPNQQNAFQSITFQQPYQKFSPEELRLADYAQGRKHGNASNQAGAFGSSNFGSFGQNPTSSTGFSTSGTSNLFGSVSNSPFGNSQPATSAFGQTSTAGGGLFGKPATSSLFGQNNAQPQSSNLFGGAGGSAFGNTPSAFGTSNAPTNTSLFGQSTIANKSPFGGFNTPASSSTSFGTPAATTNFGTGGNLFGANNSQQQSTTNPFGGAQQQPATSTNLFGGFGQQQQVAGTTSAFNNQPKPATNLFGTPATGNTGSLFGTAQPTVNTTPFGTAANTQNNSSLFGTNKPGTGGGLFGQANNQPITGGGNLFGGFNTQNQNQTPNPPQNSSIFSGLNSANNQQKSSLFPQTQQPSGTSLFGSGNQQQGGSLFGGSLLGNNQQQQQQPQQTNSIFGGNNSILGNSQQQQTQQGFTASLSDATAFGGTSLFTSLNGPPINDPGPLATPLSSTATRRKSAALPMYKLQPSSASRFSTPRRGFGFSYSNYNSPGSASSTVSTPGGMTSSLLGGTFSRGLSKSMSTSSLRRTFNTEDSILAPGAFSSSPGARQYGSTGSMKKLVINRGMRNDLFNPPNPSSQPPSTPNASILKKRVSFDHSSTLNQNANGTSVASKQLTEKANPSTEDLSYDRPGAIQKGSTSSPEMEQVRGNELALARVEEEESPVPNEASKDPVKQLEKHGSRLQEGDYWMKPSLEEIKGMNRVQRQRVTGLSVGRIGYGEVLFDAPVDFTGLNLDDLLGKIIEFLPRSLTVYQAGMQKPPMGKGLNVPSTITLANSWPRKKTVTRENVAKHVANLKKVANTQFVSYEPESGLWKFKVDHYTTYKFEDDDDEDEPGGDGASQFDQSTLSAPPDTPTPKSRTPRSQQSDESFATSEVSQTESDPEDTFQFRKKKSLPLPGAFDELYVDEDMADESHEADQQSFLDERSVGSESENGVEEALNQDDVFDDEESVSIVDQEMAGSFAQAGDTAELEEDDSQDGKDMDMVADTPGAIVRARLRAAKGLGTPTKPRFAPGNDWTNTLKTTLSPQKQDRALLKSLIDARGDGNLSDAEPTTMAPKGRVVSDGRGFANSIDLMYSLFGQTRSPVKAKLPAKGDGFEWPYAKRAKTSDVDTTMTEVDRTYHDSMKPSWGPDGTLVYAAPPNAQTFGRSSRRSRERDGLIQIQKGAVVSQKRDIRFAKFSNEASAIALRKHQRMTVINESAEGPYATLPDRFSFSDFFDDQNARSSAAEHEKLVWQLASVLFDEIIVPEDFPLVPDASDRLRKDKLSEFWQKLVESASTQQISMARSNEEKAIAALSGHRISDACGHLLNGKDFHLATLVALIEKDSGRKDIRAQLSEWQKQRVLSEFSQPIRAMYEILAGNVCVCSGSKGAPIEDRIDSFIISHRFGLDWRQAFGLRLWYGILAKDDLSAAVDKFSHDVVQDLETSKPHAWYVEQKIPTLWEDEGLNEREDLLWGLLRLYAFDDADLEAVIRPENSQLSPVDVRLSWQLSRALVSSGAAQYNEEADVNADRVTLSFASQLTSEGSWLDAVFVLLHLSSASIRSKAIQGHLAQYAGRIGSDDSQAFIDLTQTYKIPVSWVWEAKALYLRSVKRDPPGEVDCLIRAGLFEEAHRTFSRDVAPKTIIECDYNTLRTLLSGFRGRENTISEWHLGGEIYGDFLELLDSQKKAESPGFAVLNRLLAGLPAVVEESRHPGFMETVAIQTMSGVVAKAVVEIGKKGEKTALPKILRLPLTEDSYLKHTVDLSLVYYRDLMAGGK